MAEVVDLLLQSGLFAGLPKEKARQIVAIGRRKTFSAGEKIIEEGEPSSELYVIQDGLVEVLVASGVVPDVPGPPELTPVVQLGRGQVFGEMALVDQGVRSATIRCVQDGTILFVVTREAFWGLCETDYHIGYVVMRNIACDLSFKLRHRNLRMLSGG
jgi:CRP/FNR family cyclic AMP-dependent transcriptional regulator